MPEEVRIRAFDPFFTTKEAGKGTGLGLSQLYAFVTRSGGHCTIESEQGNGTTIKLYLPRYTGPISVAAPDGGGHGGGPHPDSREIIGGTGMKWRIGDVTVTKIVEMEVTGGSRFILPDATYEAVLPI